MKKRRIRRKNSFQYKRLLSVILIFVALGLIMVLQQRNVRYKSSERVLQLLDMEKPTAKAVQKPECLVVWENDAVGKQGKDMMDAVLEQMRIPYESCEAADFEPEALSKYVSVVFSITNMNSLGEGILDVVSWVKEGGSLMLLYMPDVSGNFNTVKERFGISSIGNENVLVEGMHFTRPFMLGGELQDFKITDPWDSSLAVTLSEDAEVYLESTDDNPTPLIWRYELERGSVVVSNLGFLEKAYRGFYSSAYSLLGNACAYPVINGSTFYIDDFPSPVPGGYSDKIREDYGMDIGTFYTQVWWNDVYNLANQYGVRYTGMVIEEYSDQVAGPFERNTDTRRYQYFGNMLLEQGGEIGFHGYNHMPLCLGNFDYLGMYDFYVQWESYEDMKAGLSELNEFCEGLFPKEKFQVYVPPSNILSEEGRTMLLEDFPQIRAIASVYIPGELAYDQEFQVSEDGMIETPRVISGYILDDFERLLALSELNFHFVNTHFQHPDDVLDVDRGAELGWKELSSRLSNYTEWLYTAAPDIRNLTGIELAAAVQRYDYLDVQRTVTGSEMSLELGGFQDEAWLFVRINNAEIENVTGGEVSKLLDGLYLLKAEKSHVEISFR